MTGSQVAFLLNIPDLVSADAGGFINVGNEIARLIRSDLGVRADLLTITKGDSGVSVGNVTVKQIAGAVAGNGTVTGILTSNTLLKVYSVQSDPTVTVSPSVVGGAAGTLTGVTGVTATSVLKSVVGIKDADQTLHDFTSEFTATGTGTINNTGGTSTSGYHLVVTFHAVDSVALTDLTSEFRITAADTINNTGGTSSAGKHLIVVYR